MKDLYRKLGIKPEASSEEIEAAARLRPELARQAEILLDEKRRARYDRAHAALSAIGTLRHRLGLDSGDTGFLDRHPDFGFGSRPVERQAEAPDAGRKDVPPAVGGGEQRPGSSAGGTRRSGRSVLVVVAIVVVIAIVLAILIL